MPFRDTHTKSTAESTQGGSWELSLQRTQEKCANESSKSPGRSSCSAASDVKGCVNGSMCLLFWVRGPRSRSRTALWNVYLCEMAIVQFKAAMEREENFFIDTGSFNNVTLSPWRFSIVVPILFPHQLLAWLEQVTQVAKRSGRRCKGRS